MTDRDIKRDKAGKAAGGGLHRRGFLKSLGLGATSGVAATLVGGAAEAAPADAAPAAGAAAGYRETEHVRRVYDLSRF